MCLHSVVHIISVYCSDIENIKKAMKSGINLPKTSVNAKFKMKYLYLHDVECYFEILSVLKDLLIQHVNNI